jgi:hypothetical protein
MPIHGISTLFDISISKLRVENHQGCEEHVQFTCPSNGKQQEQVLRMGEAMEIGAR